MVDEPEESKDERIGNHIVNVHGYALGMDDEEFEELIEPSAAPYIKSQMQLYIRYIRTIKPKLSPQV